MSDIGIRVDGIVLAAAIVLSLVIFATVAIITGGVAAASARYRRHALGLLRVALGQCAIGLAALLMVWIYSEETITMAGSPDWIDWLALPWLVFAGWGTVRLWRFRPA